MALVPETCQECGKAISGRMTACVDGLRIVCSACDKRLRRDRLRAEKESRRRDADPLDVLVDLAEHRRTAQLVYQKPGEPSATERLVEPYRLEATANAEMVLCWQLLPKVEDRLPWRHFRIDRIVSVIDGGSTFEPRTPITLHAGEVTEFQWGHQALIGIGPRQEYFKFIESAMMDGIFDEQELREAARLGDGLSTEERRGVHAQVFVNALQEVLADGEISQTEAAYIAAVREALQSLGWAP
ncbi:MAG: WYL domain-containing protein [Planctomycetota bacterium]|nr:WYL domain-containing protein [Planctomycetota bacterium]